VKEKESAQKRERKRGSDKQRGSDSGAGSERVRERAGAEDCGRVAG
jgi:hypothetical protein